MRLSRIKYRFYRLCQLLVQAYLHFQAHDPLRLSSSAAFFTIFALPPILILLINLLGAFFSTAIISGELFGRLQQLFGKESARLVYNILHNLQHISNNKLYLSLGVLFLLFVSTTLFIVIQRSINDIWCIRLRENQPFRQIFFDRFRSLAIILLTGLLFMAAVVSDTLLAYLDSYLEHYVPRFDVFLLRLLNRTVSLFFITVWFAILFRYLPHAHAHRRPVWAGAILTGILFTLGHFIMNRLLVNSPLSNIYDTAGSVILVLLFVFYSAMILFYGASFIKTYSDAAHLPIKPKSYAVRYHLHDLE